jgi:hypothetical protein
MGKKKQEPGGAAEKKKGWKAQMEEEERAAKAEAERLLAIKNKIKFVRARHILNEDEAVIREVRDRLIEAFPDGKPNEDDFGKLAAEYS